jgi:hypothetical protein
LIEPNLDLPWWVPLLCIALGVFLSTVLGRGDWRWFSLAAVVGAFSGLCVGYRIWWPSDPIAGPLVPISVAVNTVLAGLAATVAGVAGRRVHLAVRIDRRAAWLALAGCVAFGPVALALTSPLVAHRIWVNDQVAALRFESLKNAIQQTASDPRGRICDGSALKRHYSGPRFGDEDWGRITGNYVMQDGYFFMVYCREQGGYTIDAMPTRSKGDGTRHFCTDESGHLGCGMRFNGSRYACTQCVK